MALHTNFHRAAKICDSIKNVFYFAKVKRFPVLNKKCVQILSAKYANSTNVGAKKHAIIYLQCNVSNGSVCVKKLLINH